METRQILPGTWKRDKYFQVHGNTTNNRCFDFFLPFLFLRNSLFILYMNFSLEKAEISHRNQWSIFQHDFLEVVQKDVESLKKG
jgi:hypothetical protein